jgi:hypothetical protein
MSNSDSFDDFISDLSKRGFIFTSIIRDVPEKVFTRLLLNEAKTQIADNNEILPDGRNRLALNGSYHRNLLTPAGLIDVKVLRIADRRLLKNVCRFLNFTHLFSFLSNVPD